MKKQQDMILMMATVQIHVLIAGQPVSIPILEGPKVTSHEFFFNYWGGGYTHVILNLTSSCLSLHSTNEPIYTACSLSTTMMVFYMYRLFLFTTLPERVVTIGLGLSVPIIAYTRSVGAGWASVL